MIKNVRIELDGFAYNIVQMPGEQAFRMQLRLVNLASGLNLDGLNLSGLGSKGEAETILMIVKAISGVVNPDMVLPIIKELLATVGFISVDKSHAESNKFNSERHYQSKISLDDFYGKDVTHLYRLLYAILKANYEDFLTQAQEKLGSVLSRNKTGSPEKVSA